MKIWSLIFAAALVGAWGCSGSKEPSGTSTPGPTATKGGGEPAPGAFEPTKTPVPGSATAPGKTPAEPPKAAAKTPGKGGFFGDPKRFDIPKTGTGQWGPSKMSASQLASKVSQAIRNLKNSYSETIVTIFTPEGNGKVKSEVKIQDNKHFSIQYISVPGTMPNIAEVRADGNQKGIAPERGLFTKRKAITESFEPAMSPESLIQKWPKTFPRFVYSGLTEGRDNWSVLAKALEKGLTGFKTEVSERVLQHKGKLVRSIRVVAKRDAAAAKKHGACEMEMVFDGARNLPVTIRVNATIPKEGDYKILWQGGWNFNKKFDPKEFEL